MQELPDQQGTKNNCKWPLFFLLYVNDLHEALNGSNFKLYADDTIIFQSGVNVAEAKTKLQASLNNFCKWSTVNKLTVNTTKTKLMVFGSRSKIKKANNVGLFMNGDKLKKVPTFKYLGIVLDPTLNFNHHISTVMRTVLHKMTLLAKMKKYINNRVALLIYKTMILPYLDYADVIYHNSMSGDLNKLQRLQNRCLRVCLGYDRRFSTDRVHKLATTAFLVDRRKSHVLNFMYLRQRKGHLLNTREIRTRAHDAPLFNVKIPRCEAFKRSIGYFGSVMWNELPVDTRNANPYLLFKYNRKVDMLRPLDRIVLDN